MRLGSGVEYEIRWRQSIASIDHFEENYTTISSLRRCQRVAVGKKSAIMEVDDEAGDNEILEFGAMR